MSFTEMRMNKPFTIPILATLLTAGIILVCYFFIDRPVADAALSIKSTDWHSMAKQTSLLANALFIKTLMATGILIGACDALMNGLTRRSKHVFYLCLSVSCAMLIGDVLKDVFGRARPQLFFNEEIYGFYPLTGEYLYSSFPSGHTLRIFSIMTGLGYILPKLRLPAFGLALLVGMARVVALKHYPSDVLFGAFIGIMAAVWGWRILYPYEDRKA